MTSHRVSGPGSPEESKPQQKVQVPQKIEAVEKVGEVDEDAQTRKKFQQFMQEEEEEPEGNVPSPFDLFAGGEPPPPPPSSFGDMDDEAVPSPNYASPPDVTMAPPQGGSEEETGLPQSSAFWEGADAPPDQPLQPPSFQETTLSTTGVGAKGGKPGTKKGAQVPIIPVSESPFGPPGKPVAVAKSATVLPTKQGKDTSPPKGKGGAWEEQAPMAPPHVGVPKKGASKTTTPPEGVVVPKDVLFPIEKRGEKGVLPSKEEGVVQARFVSKEEEQGGSGVSTDVPSKKATPTKGEGVFQAQFARKEKQPGKEVPTGVSPKEPAPTKPTKGVGVGITPGVVPEEKKEAVKGVFEKEERDEEGRTETETIVPPSLSPLPAPIASFAAAATTRAAPFLSPAVKALFYQMVGTITVLGGVKGISRTEILLNSPAFSNSKFFGATITIEKYAIAPDSVNIRLTGNDEAVNAFNQNLPNLYAAFQNGNFKFRIGRIDASYTLERPLFRRKEEPGSGMGDLGGGFQDRGSQ